MAGILHNDWAPLLDPEFQKPYYLALRQFLVEEYHSCTIFPDMYDIFSALHYTPYHKVKIVILGQDPYHGPGQAHGLSFSVRPNIGIPPSLQNIYKELRDDVGCSIPDHGCLTPWAKQGVLLLNTVLTVRQGEPNSHRGKGWEIFTDRVISLLNQREQPVVFILWGSHAQQKRNQIDQQRHYVIASPHPSPLSAHRGFFGSKPFSKINKFLEGVSFPEINWQLPNLEDLNMERAG